jgi:hypothetical protein
MITKEEFEGLSPRDRGYVVYMCGAREDEPNVPAEGCIYPKDSEDYKEYLAGQHEALLEVIDGEE